MSSEINRSIHRNGCLGQEWIYLRNRTCESLIGTAIAFAHELQHFKQLGYSYKARQAVSMQQF